MDGLSGIIILLFVAISVLTQAQKVKAKDAKRKSAKDRAPQPTVEPSPSRPADAAFPPREAAMPTRRESEEGVSDWLSERELRTYMQAEETMAQALRPQADRIVQPRDYHPEAAPQDAAPVVIPGLNLKIDADALVKGVIFSEILTRRPQRRRP